MSHSEDTNFLSEWQDLKALRHLSATSSQRQILPIATIPKKNNSNNDEKEAIKECGQVRNKFSMFITSNLT